MDKPRGRLTLFIVDDSPLMSRRLTEYFTSVPHVEVCGMADNVTQAITAILANPVDVVLLDLDLGSGSGLDVLRAVKQCPHAPIVVVLTIHLFHEFGQHCLAAGADFYFEKGRGFENFLRLVEELGRHHAQAGTPPPESHGISHADRG